MCYQTVNAQQNSTKVKALYIIKFNNKTIKTSRFLIDISDVETLSLPSKSDAIKSLGAFSEDLAVIVVLKATVIPLNLSMLLTKFNLEADYKNSIVYIDNELVNNPDNILATRDMIKRITINDNRIYISTRP